LDCGKREGFVDVEDIVELDEGRLLRKIIGI
jgi:hypothetical protein